MTTGVLVMAYGSPETLADVEPYLRDIRGGRPFSPSALATLTARYERVGVPSPLRAITEAQGAALAAALGPGYRVAVGMKHWRPWIADAVGELIAAGCERVIGIAMAPHHAGMSIGGYAERVERARAAAGGTFSFTMVPDWYRQPAFVAHVARALTGTLGDWPRDEATRVFFSAHSLPARILEQGDPYRAQLLDSAGLIARAAGIDRWEFAFQSASATGEPWLGPDLGERLEAFAAGGGARALVAPIGFTADHLEILFDIDVECAEIASRTGLALRRIPSPNAAPGLIDALAAAVREIERDGARAPERPGAHEPHPTEPHPTEAHPTEARA